MQTQKLTGTVKFFNEAKGFGFIKHEDGSNQETFVHVTGLKEQVKEKIDAAIAHLNKAKSDLDGAPIERANAGEQLTLAAQSVAGAALLCGQYNA